MMEYYVSMTPNHAPDLSGWILGIFSTLLLIVIYYKMDDLEKIR